MATSTEQSIASNDDDVLVVLNPDDPAATLRAAMRDPATIDAKFHLLAVFPTAEYEARRRARIVAGVSAPYTIDHLIEEARIIAHRAGRSYLDVDDGGFAAMGAVGRTRDCVNEAVRNHDFGRVYVAERPRPAWQRVLGVGSLSTELVRVLPDVVTVVSVDEGLSPVREESDVEASVRLEAEPTIQSTDR